ncbi:MAG: PstA family ABC transporter permease [Geminicoccaceae bacterium]
MNQKARTGRFRWSIQPVDAVVGLGVVMVVVVFGMIIADILFLGFPMITPDFLLDGPRQGGRAGGIGPILVSTLLVTSIAILSAAPIGLFLAITLSEYGRDYPALAARLRVALLIFASLPSIIFGLVGNIVFCEWLGLGFSILAGGLTLGLMILPIFAFIAEESLRAVPLSCRNAAFALAMPRRRVVAGVLLPIAAPGIVNGLLLGIGRAVAESAALVLTSGYVDRMPESLFDSGRTLAVHILDLAMNIAGGDRAAYATAAVLMIILMLLNSLLFLSSRWEKRNRRCCL